MSRLLLIETSTALCSTALAEDGHIVCTRRSSEPRAHASLTAVFVKEMMDEAGWSAPDAVCVGMGPGSYTGLRVGVSTAKGLCFGWKVPLIAVCTLDILAQQAIENGLPDGCKAILPVIDARRMEVYTAPYSPSGERLGDVAPVVLDSGSFEDLFASGPVVVIGDAADKFSGIKNAAEPHAFGRAMPGQGSPCGTFSGVPEKLPFFGVDCRAHPPLADGPSGGSVADYIQCCPEASAMLAPAMQKFEAHDFEDVAYFEPFYLKQFIATTPKKLF